MRTLLYAGYVNFSSTHHDWSDGFRLVRKEKYGNMSDGLSGDYKQLLAVGGLQGKEDMWPDALKEYMQVRLVGFKGWKEVQLGVAGRGAGQGAHVARCVKEYMQVHFKDLN